MVVAKLQRRPSDVDAVAISLHAKGLTTGGISARFAEVYGDSIFQGHDLVDHRRRRGGDAGVVLEAAAGRVRGGGHDAIYVEARDGQVGNQPFCAAIGLT